MEFDAGFYFRHSNEKSMKLIGVSIAKPERQRGLPINRILTAAELGFWRTVLAIGRHLLKSAGL
jgi:hypothetical protein